MNTDTSTTDLPVRHPEWRVTRRTRRQGTGVFIPAGQAAHTPAAWVRGLLAGGPSIVPIEDRQGHYVNAATPGEAAKIVAAKFPGETKFDVQPWKDADRRPTEDRKPVYVCVAR